MSAAREELDQIISHREGESAADGFAEVVEEHIEFGGTAEEYFDSVLRLPSPLLELYAALSFDCMVRGDGLAFAIPRYDRPEFMAALANGLKLLGEDDLLSIILQAREHLRSDASTAPTSDTPNVTFDEDVPELSNAAYFKAGKSLMSRIGDFLKSKRELVLAATSRLGS